MPLSRAALLVLGLAAPLPAQQGPSRPSRASCEPWGIPAHRHLWGGDRCVSAPLAGATVEAIGNRGGTQTTDSAGRFAFPEAVVGAGMVRARHAGYAERRVMLSVDRGRGRELSIALAAAFSLQPSVTDG